MKINSKVIIQTLIFSVIGFALLIFIWNQQAYDYAKECKLLNLDQSCKLSDRIYQDLASVYVEWILVVALLYFMANVFRALRWRLILKVLKPDCSYGVTLASIMIAYLLNLFIARSGELAQVGIVSRQEKLKYQEVLGTLIFDRIADFIALIVFTTLGVIISFRQLKEHFYTPQLAATVQNRIWLLFVFAILGLVFVYGIMKISIRGRSVRQRLKEIIGGLRKGLTSITKVPQKGIFILYTAIIWTIYYLMMYGTFLMYEATRKLEIWDALMISVCGSLGAIIPTPGGVGGYQAIVREGLESLGLNSTDAFSFALLSFLIVNIIIVIAFGILALIQLLVTKKRIL